MNGYEIEVKFLLGNIEKFQQKLEQLNAKLKHARVHEKNYRFDTNSNELQQNHRVLRLRQDSNAILTYKDPAQTGDSVSIRREIEFQVSDFEAAYQFLEALNYHVSIFYEKYRTTYSLNNCLITIDEMPYGNFAEIEGPDANTIENMAKQLDLNWQARCTESYMVLLNRIIKNRDLDIENLSFAEFSGFTFKAADFELIPADET